ncbi:MAG: hypothetical protein HW416_318 [Chloroflexi bacterium]|nr:hypothetical protein [Chloroflexota bacterium]
MRLALVSLLAAASLMTLPMGALAQTDLAAINLSAADVGDTYTLDESRSGTIDSPDVHMHSALFDRRPGVLQEPGPYLVASLLATTDRGVSPVFLEKLVEGLSQDPALEVWDGPAIGSETRWYHIALDSSGIARDQHIVGFIAGNTAVAVLTVGVGGRSDQGEVARLARLIASRLE